MKRRQLVSMSLALFFCLGVCAPALAQWSGNPMQNLAVADAVGDQVQPKVVARPAGGYYVSWFDNRTGGYDVYLQLLDEQGVEQWAQNGVLVADRSFSSTQDYGLSVDTAGDALLAFRDDRFGDVQITAAKVDVTGALVWGANGVQLTSGTAFVAAPKIAGTTDGESVVAWKNDADGYLQRLDAAGAAVWNPVVVISDPMSRDYSPSDLRASDGGSVIVSLVFQPSGFLGPKHLHAQKISDLGTNLWGSSPLVVYDGGSLQFGNFPGFVSDGSGGAAFSWYNTNGELQCYAQHVDSAGTESFPHNGSAVSTGPRERTNPDVAYDPGSASTYVFWDERQPGGVPQYGIYGQRFNTTGVLQWGSEGIAVAALTTTEVGFARVTLDGTDATASWVRTSSFNDQSILASRVDANGATVWTPAQTEAATSMSGKSRLVAEAGNGFVVLGWSDNRSGNDDVYVQNVNDDGTLGTGMGTVCGDGVVDAGEECDEGPKNSNAPGATCREDCTLAGCGDGIVDPSEECDEGDANSNSPGADCREDCSTAGCGDGIVDPGEECDLGESNSDDPGSICFTDCTLNPDLTIPTVSEWGLIIMGVLFVALGAFVFRYYLKP